MKSDTQLRDEFEPTRVWYDCERTEPVSEAVVAAVNEHTRRDAELPPLTEHVDTDALDALFGCDTPGAPRVSGASLEFDYADLVVTVESVGRIEVRDAGR
ncbi:MULTISPECIES: HalOD1 output domain-containing protein [unclassified Haloferax]|uniref:HalOD1 output domain-containing protein n=1 Tax=unclassified Haloferax TaxID=2625095 RepID=UPI0014288A58|nr:MULTISPECIES: HalOD1 output domain-containing protein [Haloferax]